MLFLMTTNGCTNDTQRQKSSPKQNLIVCTSGLEVASHKGPFAASFGYLHVSKQSAQFQPTSTQESQKQFCSVLLRF